MGSGVDICSPIEDERTYNEICKKGLVIFAFPPKTKANMGTFPARNKIIAGLSLGVLVTEGAEDSGSLITADFALKFNRKIFAIPGPITSSLSKGVNKLIKNGAVAVTDFEDIIDNLNLSNFNLLQTKERLNFKKSEVLKDVNLTIKEKEILQVLNSSPLHFDEIVRKMGGSTSEIGGLLSLMEIKGIVKNDKGIYSL